MSTIFEFQVSPLELVVRGTLIYWFLFLLFRFALRRESGSLGLADILVIVLIADAAQNGMSGDYKSVSEAMVLVGTIAGWNYVFDWMSYRYAWFARFTQPEAVMLVRHGRLLRANLQKEMLTEEELKSQLRQSGVDDLKGIKHARLEPDGHISVIPYSESGGDTRRKNGGTPGAA